MTNKELRALLEALPDDMEVVVYSDCDETWQTINSGEVCWQSGFPYCKGCYPKEDGITGPIVLLRG